MSNELTTTVQTSLAKWAREYYSYDAIELACRRGTTSPFIPFCDKCGRDVDRVDYEFGTRIVDSMEFGQRREHTGEITVTISCHGEVMVGHRDVLGRWQWYRR